MDDGRTSVSTNPRVCTSNVLQSTFAYFNSEYNGRNQTNTEDKLEQENKKKRERFEAARQAALKEATVADVAQSSQRKPQGDAGAPRTRGYDRLTVFPAGDRELELTAADHVSDISIHGVGRQESV